MRRHYFIGDSLDDLERLEQELEAAGVSTARIHALTHDDAAATRHRGLHEVQSILKKDVVHSARHGALIGFFLSVLTLGAAYVAGVTRTGVGWMPFVFLAIALLGFCAWVGGLFGIEKPNRHFARFENTLNEGKHILFVDLESRQEAVLEALAASHPRIEPAGTGATAPRWLISLQHRAGTGRRS